jgi:hypothetical protein
MAGQAGVVAGPSVEVVVGAAVVGDVEVVDAVPRPAEGTESPVVQAPRTRASASPTALLLIGPCCQP